jgi:hypothetical protein
MERLLYKLADGGIERYEAAHLAGFVVSVLLNGLAEQPAP